VTLTNLVIKNNAGAGIRLSNSDGSRITNVRLEHNEGGFDCTPVSIHNAIFYNDNPGMEGTLVWYGPEVQLDSASNNLYYNPYRADALICAEFARFNGRCYSDVDINSGAWKEVASRAVDPGFANPATKDFHLGSASPAINTGLPGGAPFPGGPLADWRSPQSCAVPWRILAFIEMRKACR